MNQVEIETYTCVFCQYILQNPVTLKCKHSFCLCCLEGYLKCLKLDKVHLEKKKKIKLIEIKCPTCRAAYKLNINNLDSYIDKNLINEICTHFKSEYEERTKQIEKETKEEMKNGVNMKRLAIGNSYKEIKTPGSSRDGNHVNKHKWIMFVRLEGVDDPSKYIEKVFFELHPTFRKNKIFVKQPKDGSYEISRIGWGTFDIPCIIYFKKKFNIKPFKYEHELVFSGAGAYHHVDIDLTPQKKKKN